MATVVTVVAAEVAVAVVVAAAAVVAVAVTVAVTVVALVAVTVAVIVVPPVRRRETGRTLIVYGIYPAVR